MDSLTEKYKKLGIDNAPGQEALQKTAALDLRGEKLPGLPVDFSHGDVDAFPPLPGSREAFDTGFALGGKQAYTEYRGKRDIRADIAAKLAVFTGAPVDPDRELILTPGTQGALFLAMGALVGRGDKVAIVEPDYFANRKLTEFFDGELLPVQMDYKAGQDRSGIDLEELERAFRAGAKLFLFSNPNNPTGAVYSYGEICAIAALAKRFGAALIVDELYSRQVFDGRSYTHLRAQAEIPDNLITILGPSKTESLSGFRLGAAFGTSELIDRMEKLQAIVSLRAAGYCQAVYSVWFREPEGFMERRIAAHAAIRDDLMAVLARHPGVSARKTDAGSYLFVELPELEVSIGDFARILRELARVTVTPGTEFGPQFTRHFRINFSQDHAAAVAAMERAMAVMERYRRG